MGQSKSFELGLAAVAAALASISPIHASPFASLSAPWSLQDDESYSHFSDYRAPGPVKGLALHGYVAEGDLGVWYEKGQVLLAPTKDCPVVTPIADSRHLPAEFDERTSSEFWFFRSGFQSLYISINWNFVVGTQCQVELKPDVIIARLVEFNGRVSMAVKGGQFPGSSTISPGETGLVVPPQFLRKPDGAELRSHKPERRYRRDLPGPDVQVRRECYDSSIAFFFSTGCYLTEPGEWYGLAIYGDGEADDGSNFSRYAVTDIDTDARIDGRLFEWDRAIRFVGRK